MNKNIVIVHYNTPHLTECLVKSINLFVENANIYIFDNSDKHPFMAKFDNVTVFDNTKGQIIDFDKWLSSFKRKAYSKNKWASAKHCYSVEKCMELIDDNFILLDSDVFSHRDQLSFNYVLWKNKDIKVIYMDKNIYKSKYFNCNSGHRGKLSVKNVLNGKATSKTITQARKEFREVINKTRMISTYKLNIYN